MTLAVGSRLGAYELVAAIGAGGMGEVYRARDTKLNRDVALKVLPEAFALDPDRLARFKREAQVLASLNHPHIAHIYGLEGLDRQEGQDGISAFIVMELVDGDDLAERLRRGPLPFDEALPIARQIAEALEAAHEQGLVHRDLKPANIKLRPDGTVKVLDFGLAKALDQSSASHAGDRSATMSPTITTPAMTQMGMILGTAAYMSPEQAKGRPADKRSDVWSFGCVLYEVLSGKRPFEGEDVSDTLAAVLRAEPDWNALPPETPAPVRTLIKQCLTKDRRQRVGDLSVARFVLADPASLGGPVVASTTAITPSIQRRRLDSSVRVAAAVVVTAAVVGGAAWKYRPLPPSPPVVRFPVTLPSGQVFANVARHFVAISPDGSHLVYAANNRLYLRSLAEFEAHAIPGTEAVTASIDTAFSPDGLAIAFYTDSAIKRVGLAGGMPTTICPVDAAPFGVTWDTSGIVFAQSARGIFRCSTNGGTPEQLVTIKDGEQAQSPQMLSDGSAVLYAVGKIADGTTRWDKAEIVIQTLKSGARKTIVRGGSDPRYLPTGHLLYAIGGIVYAVPFDQARQEITGNGVPVIEGVRRPNSGNSGAAHLATSQTGTLIYVPGPVGTATAAASLALADRAGVVTRLSVSPGPYVHVRASRDGTRLAVGSDDGKEAIVWIYELGGTSAMRRLTIAGHNRFPIWSPDGQRIAYQSDREGDLAIFSQRADGTGAIERLTKPAQGEAHVPESWSPDGKHLSFAVVKGSFSLWTLSVDDKIAKPFDGVQSTEPLGSVFAPDGRWIAYTSSPAGGGAASPNRGVFIQPFPAAGSVYQAPRQRLDFQPVWGPKGAELIYVASAASLQYASVSVTTQPAVTFGTPVNLPARVTANRLSGEPRAYDILPDGRFVGLVSGSEPQQTDDATTSQIRVVVNWFEELNARVPAR
jgi:serine/threonine-protein kinase